MKHRNLIIAVTLGSFCQSQPQPNSMQVSISGPSSAAWFALFVLDASKPVTSPAKFD